MRTAFAVAPHTLSRSWIGFIWCKNLREAIEAFLHDQRPALQAAAACTAQVLTQVAGPVAAPTMYRGRHRCSQVGQRRQEAAQQHRHAAWVTTYEAIHTLRAQGTSVTAIAAQLGISRPTVYAYLRRPGPRVRAVRSGPARCCGRTWRIWSNAGGRGVRTACSSGARCARWAMRTPPGRSPDLLPGCGGRAPRAGPLRRRPRPIHARKGRRPGRSRSPGYAPKRSGRRTRSCMLIN